MVKFAWVLLSLVWSVSAVFAEGSAVVLCYHSFIGKNYDTDFAPEVLQKQIESIQALGYRFVSFDEVVSGRVSGNSNVLLTIDDGNRSVRAVYDTIFRPKGIKPLLFIYPAIIDRLHYALSTADLENYLKDGAAIGGHGYYHLYVNKKLYDQDPKAFHKEIFLCKEKLERKIGRTVAAFGYPFGSFSEITIETLQKAGFSYAFSLRHDTLKVPLEKNQNLYDLPRFMVTKGSWKYIYQFMKDNLNREQRHTARGKGHENS